MTHGLLFIIIAPSGAGKTSLVRELVSSVSNLSVSISHTTRSKRPNEIDGQNYFFVTEEIFRQMISDALFLEHACVFGRYYGTSKTWVEQQLTRGTDVILEIDWQGAQQIKQLYPKSVGIFILPPSLASLEERLRKRGQDSESVIARRLDEAQNEIQHAAEFDYVIVNEHFDTALNELIAIIHAARQGQPYSPPDVQPILNALLTDTH